MDTKQKCQGCGAETMSDVGWCLACRSILYTDFQISKSDFRQSEFKTMVFPVRDIIWLQERVRLRDAEIKAIDTVNDEMGVTIQTLRDDISEARADNQRLTAELAQARNDLARTIDTSNSWCDKYAAKNAELAIRTSSWEDGVDRCSALLEERQRLIAELAQARAERDAAQAAHVAMHKAYGHVTGLVPFDPQSELKQLRASNHYMIEELTRLRAKQSGQQAGE